MGRILNRFSHDTNQMDDGIPWFTNNLLVNILQLLAAFIIICVNLPFVMIPAIPIFLVFYWLQRFFRRSSAELKRLEAISRSPLFAQFTATLNGLDTLRAFGMADEFLARNRRQCYYLFSFFFLFFFCHFLGMVVGWW